MKNEKLTCSGESYSSVADWVKNQVKQEEIDKYLENGHDFIDDAKIKRLIAEKTDCSKERLRDILAKAHDINLMDDEDVAYLVNIKDPEMRQEVFKAAEEIKKRTHEKVNGCTCLLPALCATKPTPQTSAVKTSKSELITDFLFEIKLFSPIRVVL